MNLKSNPTRRKILEAAEQLYGSAGVAATSLRGIVREADVNLNAVNYHFGSKHRVTAELFRSIMQPINEDRKGLLEAVDDESPSLRRLVHAIYWPIFRRAVESESGRRQIDIVNQIRQDPSPYARELVKENLEEFVPFFEARLAKATGRTRARLKIPIRLMIATAWGLVSQSIVLDELAFKKSKRSQQRVFEQFLDYVTAGFDRLLER